MQCPNDQTTLAMMDRQGIEIDYCPTCRGVWLDRGELDKLIAGNETSAPAFQSPPQNYQQPQHQEYRKDYNDRPSDRHDSYGSHKKRKKESFLGELFDF